MTLIKSISGIRGTIGGEVGSNLTPVDIVKYTSSFGIWIKSKSNNDFKVVIGRDSRLSGKYIINLVESTLIALNIDVINIEMTTTPTLELAVIKESANGGIMITASHNPKNWNALKLIDSKGEFLDNIEGEKIINIAKNQKLLNFSSEEKIGKIFVKDFLHFHINLILNLPIINIKNIKESKFKVVVDGINSSGGIYLPYLLNKMGADIVKINCNPNGDFSHNPEPLNKNLSHISKYVVEHKADIGLVVDPDVDRLSLICEDGSFFGEEYTLVAVADYVLSKKKGNTVSNLSSTMALKDLSLKYGVNHYSSPVGEVNVRKKMKEVDAVIGGEGNGGVILPELHYGRDALVASAIILAHLSETKLKISDLRKKYKNYFMSKKKVEIKSNQDFDLILTHFKNKYFNYNLNLQDGLKINFDNEWVHLRKSNTEPIIRVYSESVSQKNANELTTKIINEILKINLS